MHWLHRFLLFVCSLLLYSALITNSIFFILELCSITPLVFTSFVLFLFWLFDCPLPRDTSGLHNSPTVLHLRCWSTCVFLLVQLDYYFWYLRTYSLLDNILFYLLWSGLVPFWEEIHCVVCLIILETWFVANWISSGSGSIQPVQPYTTTNEGSRVDIGTIFIVLSFQTRTSLDLISSVELNLHNGRSSAQVQPPDFFQRQDRPSRWVVGSLLAPDSALQGVVEAWCVGGQVPISDVNAQVGWEVLVLCELLIY